MLNLGTVKPGETIYIPFHTFDSNDPSASVTLTGLAVTDIECYKDGGVTQRASDNGYTLLDTDGIDFDGITGIHGFSIDLSDNTTANFWEAGSRYFVIVSSITVDAATINFVAATFRIGYPGAILDTTVATLASQTSFTLEEGSADNDAYNGCIAYVHDLASAVQVAIGYLSDYAGATKTVTLAADPGIFTIAAGDNISLFPPAQVASWNNVPLATTNPLPSAAADAAGGLPISDAGGLDLDAKLANTNEVTAARMGALTDWINGGRLDLLLDAIPTTAMRGTDNAALASVVGALNDAAAAGDPTTADTLMQYVKQLINVLVGTTGVTTFPAEAAPANNVSLAEVIRAIHADVTGLAGAAMRGTDGANTTTPLTAAQVNAEVVDALATDTYAEPASVPAATSSIKDKIGWLFTLSRNKGTQTATLKTLRNDADGADIATALVADDGTTFTRDEWT